jgi:ribosomal protein L31
MLKFLESNSTSISQDTFTEKFANKKILVMGSGPSVNLVNWKNLDIDGIVTTSFFYLNDEIRNLSNITHITLTDIVDLEHPNLIEFIEKNPACTIAFEPKSHPFYQTEEYKKFVETYKEQIIYYNTQYGKKEGVAGRVCYFIIQFFHLIFTMWV